MKFNIAYAPDDKYINQTIVSMVSAIENNKEHEIEFIIIYSKLSEESIKKLKRTIAPTRFSNLQGEPSQVEKLPSPSERVTLRLLQTDENIFSSLPLSHWVTVQAWFRIKLPDMCPDLDKILYLDCDTLILGDLSELFNTNLDGKFLAGVKDVWGVDRYCKRLSMASGVYVNSGMLLFNADFCRKENFFDKIVEFANNNAKIIEFCDQDSINKIADEKKVVLNPKFNLMDTWWRGGYYEFDGEEEQEYLMAKENPVIAHLTGLKPAFKGSGNKFKDKWWEYAKLTPIYEELVKDYENSKPPKEPLKDKIFSIKNRYEGKTKLKILTILGLKFVLSKRKYK